MALWRKQDFLKLWVGQTISEIGSRVTREGVPLTAVLLLHATPAQMGLLASLGGWAALLSSPVAGMVADRVRRKPLMIAADVLRGTLLAAIPLAAATGALSFPLLCAVVAGAGVLTVFFDVSYQTYLPTLVERDELVEGNSKLMVSMATAEVVGPGLTGVLVQWLTAPRAILVDAISFFVSAASLMLIRRREARPTPHDTGEDNWRQLGAGFRFVWGHELLRPLALRLGTTSFFWGFFVSLYVLFAVDVLKLQPAVLGVVIALGGVGALCGALASERVAGLMGVGRALIGATLLQGTLALLVPLAGGPSWMAAALLGTSQLIGDFSYPIYNVHETALRQAVTPPGLLGRVNGAMQVLFKGVLPFGSLAGGMLASATSVRVALAVSALGVLLSAGWLVFSPVRRLRQMPGPSAR